MSVQNNGVAPFWVATGDGDYDIPDKMTCVGIYLTTGGVVSFDSYGSTVEPTFGDETLVPAKITKFNATNTTASGIYALLIK